MNQKTLTPGVISRFAQHLRREEKSAATIEKYQRDVMAFSRFAGKAEITKELVVDYKRHLLEAKYAVRSINSMLASLNSLLGFLGLPDCRVRNVRQQRQTFCTGDKELSKDEYRSSKSSHPSSWSRRTVYSRYSSGVGIAPTQGIFAHCARRSGSGPFSPAAIRAAGFCRIFSTETPRTLASRSIKISSILMPPVFT